MKLLKFMAVAALLTLVQGCFSQDNTGVLGQQEEKRKAELLSQAKEYLAGAEPHMAKVLFEQILDELEPGNPQASFGLGLCYFQDTIELVSMLFSVVSGGANFLGVRDTSGMSENEYVAMLLSDILQEIESRLGSSAELFELAALEPDFSFRIEPGALMYLDLKPALKIGEDLDSGDAYLLAYVSRTIHGLLELIDSFGLQSDLMAVVARAQNNDLGALEGKTITGVITYLLNSDSRFLTLNAGKGKNAVVDAARSLAKGQRDMVKGLELIAAETDDQSDDYLTLSITGRGRKKRRVLNISGVWNKETDEFETVGIVLDDRFESSLEALAANLDGNAKPLSWAGDVMPVLDTLVLAVIHQNLLAKIGLDLPEELTSMFKSMTPEDFGEFLVGLIPDAFTLDLGTALGTAGNEPVDLRSLLPLWTNDLARWENRPYMEYECPADLDSDGFPSGTLKLFCNKDAELEDSSHFAGTEFEMGPDMIAGKLPYMQWPDPSFNGLLMLDMSKSKIQGYGAGPGFKTPDNRDFNAFLQKVAGNVLFLVGK